MTQQHSIPYHRLCWLSVVGGFMDGTRIEFAPGLNCIIGARGTGKTTVLEFIRFALDTMPDDTTACRRIESLVNRNLDFGRVELGIETKDGLAYVVSRAADEEPMILTEDGKPTGITLKAGSFFKADVFSQNEVESIADRSLSQLELLDNFEAEEIVEINTQLKHLGVELMANANGIQPLQEKIATLEEELVALPGIEEQLKGYSATSGTDGAAIDAAHAQKALRERESRAIQLLTERMNTLGNDLKVLSGFLSQETQTAISDDILGGPNQTVFAEIMRSMQDASREVDGYITRAKDVLLTCWNQVQEHSKVLATAHTAQEMAFRALIEKHHAAMGQATERSRLEKARNDLLAKRRERDDAAEKLKKLQADRVDLMKRLSEHRDTRFSIRKTVADKINQSLSPNIRVSIMQDGNSERFTALVEEALRGGRLKQGQVAQKIVNAMWPADLVKIARERNADELVNKAELNPDQVMKTIAALVTSGRLHEIETVELIDQPRIELKDGGSYKDSQSLSTGQKCTTILPILLMESEKPLLVDQPEDNLDNRFISQTVVESLHKVKQRRQLVFVTHNPNIPVLGDAEKVFVLESDGTHASLVKDGTVDECKAEIVTLLEGGEDAFKQRKERYKY